MTDPREIEALCEKARRAQDLIHQLCIGERSWTMSVPAREDSDPDLVLSGTIRDLTVTLRALAAENAGLREEMELRQRLYDAHPGPREEELAALRGRLRVVCQKAVAVVGATGPTSAEDAVDALAAQLAAARKERAFLAEHFRRIRRAACGWDAATGHVTAWEFVAENFEPRRSTVSFCDIFSTFDEALAHLMAQVAAIDAAKGGA